MAWQLVVLATLQRTWAWFPAPPPKLSVIPDLGASYTPFWPL